MAAAAAHPQQPAHRQQALGGEEAARAQLGVRRERVRRGVRVRLQLGAAEHVDAQAGLRARTDAAASSGDAQPAAASSALHAATASADAVAPGWCVAATRRRPRRRRGAPRVALGAPPALLRQAEELREHGLDLPRSVDFGRLTAPKSPTRVASHAHASVALSALASAMAEV